MLGGGQEAMEVTITSTKAGKFDARFYHLIFEEEFGRVKGHFGPINSLAFHPDGKRYGLFLLNKNGFEFEQYQQSNLSALFEFLIFR